MSMSLSRRRHQQFAELHQSGCFIIPNPWDLGSARMMAALGAKALATTSSGFSFTLGRPDMGTVSRDEALAHAEAVVAATPLPVSGDLENGFGDSPDEVVETVKRAAEAGLSGCSIEDKRMIEGNPAYDRELAVERIKAGADAARQLGRPFIFCARADGYMNGVYDLDEAMARLQAFDQAGADLLYAPLLPDLEAIRRAANAVAAPLNVLAAGPTLGFSLSELAAAGARRISLGSSVARLAQTAIYDATRQMLEEGRFAALEKAASGDLINELLARGAALPSADDPA